MIAPVYKTYALTALCCVLTSCVKKEVQQSRVIIDNVVHVDQARLSDISFPLGARLLPQTSDTAYLFTTQLDRNELMRFFELEMENYGWKQVVIFNEHYMVLVFEKPHKTAAIIAKQSTKSSRELKVSVLILRKN